MSWFVMASPVMGLIIAALSLWVGTIFGRMAARPDLEEKRRDLQKRLDVVNGTLAARNLDLRQSGLSIGKLREELRLEHEALVQAHSLLKERDQQLSDRDETIVNAGGTIQQQSRRIEELEKQVEKLQLENDELKTTVGICNRRIVLARSTLSDELAE